MTPTTTVYLISGANRGLGLACVAHILATHETAFVYAGARTPSSASSLKDLQNKYPDRLAIVKCVSADIEGNVSLAKEIEARHGYVDTVIANAGISNTLSLVSDVTLSQLQDHFQVNVFGTIMLFQATLNLLKKSSEPRFISISSPVGSIGDDSGLLQSPLRSICYGASKASMNWATRKIHFENEWLVAFPLSPGAVDTDMLNTSLANDHTGVLKGVIPATGIPKAETAAAMIIRIIDESTREREGGEFINVDGAKIAW